MVTIDNVYFHFFHPQYRIFFAFVLAIIFNVYAIHVSIRISRAKKLYPFSDERNTDLTSIPVFGGLGLFVTIVSVSLTFINGCRLNVGGITNSLTSIPSIIAGLTAIFFIGVKIDLLDNSHYKKVIGEFLALIILIVIGDVRLISLQGMFNIEELSYSGSILLSLFAGIIIINAFNLIDGIDGLAALLTLLGCIIFGTYFGAIFEWEYSVLSFTIIGALIPFIYYNVFSRTNKIILGDTGSHLLGFAMTVLVFRFNQINSIPLIQHVFMSSPSFSFAVVLLPVFDTMRVFILRWIYRGKYSFKSDRRHIHNIMLALGFTPMQSILILFSTNLAIIAFAYFFNFLGNSTLVCIMILVGIVLSILASWFLHTKRTLFKKSAMVKMLIDN